MAKVIFITTYVDVNILNRCIRENPFINNDPDSSLYCIKNTEHNLAVPLRYNQFLNQYDYTHEAWFVFCHSDWEIMENPSEAVSALDVSCLYGPIGRCLERSPNGSLISRNRGAIYDRQRDGSRPRILEGTLNMTGVPVDAFDCQALFVHSSLIQKYGLRFDERFSFDLYVEDFCINARECYGIQSKILSLKCCHWNQIEGLRERPKYYETLEIFNNKYPESLYSGVCSLLGGASRNKQTLIPDEQWNIQPWQEHERDKIYAVTVDPSAVNDSRTFLFNFTNENTRVLDVGCACGDLGVALHEYKHCTVYGFEYNSESARIARETGAYEHVTQLDLNSFSADDFPEYKGFFDYIICGDVLEHLYRPDAVLKQLVPFLRPGGQFLLSLPNLAHASIKANLLLNDFTYTDVGLLDRTHIRFFTHNSIPRFLGSLQLIIDDFTYTVSDGKGFQPGDPYPALPPRVIKFLFADPHSYIIQYVLKVSYAPEKDTQECCAINEVIATIDRSRNQLFLPISKQEQAKAAQYGRKRLYRPVNKLLMGMALLPASVAYSASAREWLHNLRQGRIFFRQLLSTPHEVMGRLGAPCLTKKLFVLWPMKFALKLHETQSLPGTLKRASKKILRTCMSFNKGGFGVKSPLPDDIATSGEAREYSRHVLRAEPVLRDEIDTIFRHIEHLPKKPLISIGLILPATSNNDNFLMSVRSVKEQIYPNWELLILSQDVPNTELEKVLGALASDSRIKLLCTTQNDSQGDEHNILEACLGEFLFFLDSGDTLSRVALYRLAVEIIEHPEATLIYSDCDILEDGSRHSPLYKPDWNEELQLGQDYLSRLTAFKRETLHSVGGFKKEYGPLAAYDAGLRISAATGHGAIRHIPHVLYHYGHRDYCLFTPAQQMAAAQAVRDHLENKGVAASVQSTALGTNRIIYHVPEPAPKVTCIVAMRDQAKLTRNCIRSLLKTDYPNIRILLIDNRSVKKESRRLFDALKKEPRVSIIHWDKPFNHSQMMNMGVQAADGEYVALINNDTEFVNPGWLKEMLGYAQQEHIGAVGTRLLYADDTLQHTWIVMGTKGKFGHAFRGKPANIAEQKQLVQTAHWVSGVTGACLVIARKKYLEVGGMNEKDFPIGYNDVEFCLRLLKQGYHNCYTPFTKIYHYESQTRKLYAEDDYQKEISIMDTMYKEYLQFDAQYNPNLAEAGTYAILHTSQSARQDII